MELGDYYIASNRLCRYEFNPPVPYQVGEYLFNKAEGITPLFKEVEQFMTSDGKYRKWAIIAANGTKIQFFRNLLNAIYIDLHRDEPPLKNEHRDKFYQEAFIWALKKNLPI